MKTAAKLIIRVRVRVGLIKRTIGRWPDLRLKNKRY